MKINLEDYYMNWNSASIEDLRRYNALRNSLKNIEERIELLNYEFTSVGSPQFDRVPNRGGGNKMEDFIISNISERQRLDMLYKVNKKMCGIIKRGLSALTADERKVLEVCYIDSRKNDAEAAMEELSIERSEFYRLRDRALRNFTVNMFGICEL